MTAPFSTLSAIGLDTSISAAARFTKNGGIYHFDSWADGGSRLRQIEIPDHASGVTARYFEDKAFGRPATDVERPGRRRGLRTAERHR